MDWNAVMPNVITAGATLGGVLITGVVTIVITISNQREGHKRWLVEHYLKRQTEVISNLYSGIQNIYITFLSAVVVLKDCVKDQNLSKEHSSQKFNEAIDVLKTEYIELRNTYNLADPFLESADQSHILEFFSSVSPAIRRLNECYNENKVLDVETAMQIKRNHSKAQGILKRYNISAGDSKIN